MYLLTFTAKRYVLGGEHSQFATSDIFCREAKPIIRSRFSSAGQARTAHPPLYDYLMLSSRAALLYMTF